MFHGSLGMLYYIMELHVNSKVIEISFTFQQQVAYSYLWLRILRDFRMSRGVPESEFWVTSPHHIFSCVVFRTRHFRKANQILLAKEVCDVTSHLRDILVSFVCCCDQIPEKINFKVKWFILVPGCRISICGQLASGYKHHVD